MFFVVSYDIVDNKKRTKVANILEDYGTRVQYSVFECNLTKKLLDKMTDEMLKCINVDKDSLRIYEICEGCKPKIQVHGKGKVAEDEDVIVI